jgi:threonine synthase
VATRSGLLAGHLIALGLDTSNPVGIHEKCGLVIDPHTADGIKVGLENREPDIALICIETALAAKFEVTLKEALGRNPERPQGHDGSKDLPQVFKLMDADADEVKEYIKQHADN